MDEYLKVPSVFQIRFSPEIAGKQASKQQNVPTLSLSITKKLRRQAGGVVVVVVTDRLQESFWRVSSYMEGSAYAYAYAYVCKRARLLEQM